MIITYH